MIVFNLNENTVSEYVNDCDEIHFKKLKHARN